MVQWWLDTKRAHDELVIKGGAYETFRKVIGTEAQLFGWINAEGRAQFRTSRTEGLKELKAIFGQTTQAMIEDTEASQILMEQRMNIADHNDAVGSIAINHAKFRIDGSRQGLRGEELTRWVNEQAGKPPPIPPRIESNRHTATEYTTAIVQGIAGHIWAHGNLAFGAPYQNRYEWALREYVDSLTLSIHAKDPKESRYRQRRMAENCDVLKDLAAIYAMESGGSLRQGAHMVWGEYASWSIDNYKDRWLEYYRGMPKKRDELYEKYKDPENNVFGVEIPKGKTYETLAPKLAPAFTRPGLSWGEQGERVQKKHGDNQTLTFVERTEGFSSDDRGRGGR